jgi:hypothetical protein
VKVRAAYEAQARKRRELTATRIRSLGVDLLEFVNGKTWLPSLMAFFQSRRHRSG